VPYADNNGIRIRYEVDGSGPPLVLHVGFAGWLENWADAGYVAALRETNRLVLLDPRGQGRSDGLPDPAAYAANNRVGDILAVLDAEGIDRAHFWGYSMGGHVGYALGRLAPGRVRSLILGGASPFAGYPRSAEGDAMMDSLRKGMAGLAAQWEAEFPDCWLSPGERERTLASDAKALVAARLAHRQSRISRKTPSPRSAPPPCSTSVRSTSRISSSAPPASCQMPPSSPWRGSTMRRRSSEVTKCCRRCERSSPAWRLR
jgi:pimeloyl-ACP methyl ester carboxylesterase